ncbi:hypothetical protein ABIA35_004368 [Catenulispora sp. MAP12-49]|uniref:hypothetical protein n=1 Tax=Catenulispora sp. MAP12-49 TaxID=3156302 RepID=UPI003514EE6C
MDDTGFRPTHVTPLDGMPTWAGPDTSQPSAWLDPLLPVQITDARGDWARVLCANGWAAWVDGRLLVALPGPPPGTGHPPAFTTDPRPLLAELERALSTYRQLVERLAAGEIDLQTFRDRSARLRLGVVVDGESAWLLDLEHDRWWYCHDTQVQTFATVEAPPDSAVDRAIDRAAPDAEVAGAQVAGAQVADASAAEPDRDDAARPARAGEPR